jgi:hypothetical protein
MDLRGDPVQVPQDLALASAQDLVDNCWHVSSRSSRIV